MARYRVVTVADEVAREVRSTGRSPRYGHPAHTEVATGYGPCRVCLRFFRKGEEMRILFTYDAFQGTGDPPLPGPVFVHATSCQPYAEGAGFPRHLGEHALTLDAYARGGSLRAVERVEAGPVEPALERLLALADVDYVQVRDTSAGCFDLRVERL